MSIGKLGEFDLGNGVWSQYVDRIEQYFLVNNTEDKLKTATLITMMGADAYDLLINLCTPDKPADKSFGEINKIMSQHLQPSPSMLAERYKFRQRRQDSTESLAEYIAALKKLSKFCQFEAGFEENLRDQFICGIRNELIRLRLFEEEKLTLQQACKLAMSLESAEKDAAAVDMEMNNSKFHSAEAALSYTKKIGSRGGGGRGRGRQPAVIDGRSISSQPTRSTPSKERNHHKNTQICNVCGAVDHDSWQCSFRNTCRVCDKEGHLKKTCPQMTQTAKVRGGGGGGGSRHYYVEQTCEEDSSVSASSESDEYRSFCPSRRTFCRGKSSLNMTTNRQKNNTTREADCAGENSIFSDERDAGDGASEAGKSDISDASLHSPEQRYSVRSSSWSQYEGTQFSGAGNGPLRSRLAQHLNKRHSFESDKIYSSYSHPASKLQQNNYNTESTIKADIHKENQKRSAGRNSQPKVCQQNNVRPERVPLIKRIATALKRGYNANETEYKHFNWMVHPFVFCLVLALLYGIIYSASIPTSHNPGYAQSDFQQDLNKIGKKYNIESDTMLKIQTGIETTLKKQDTLSVVYLYNSIDEELVMEIVNKVAYASAKFLRNTTDLVPIIVNTSDVGTNEELIDKYKEEILNQGVLIVQDLENIPVNLAMAFYYYCDEKYPLVKNTAIFFTLNLAKCRNKAGNTQHQMAESCLTDKWGTLDDQEKLAPLLARVVSIVVDLENGMKQSICVHTDSQYSATI